MNLRQALLLAGLLSGMGLGVPAQSAPLPGHGVLVHLPSAAVASFDANHTVASYQLNPNRDLYLVVAADGRTDQALLTELQSDPVAGQAEFDAPMTLAVPAATLDGQSTASVLNGQSTASVLNGGSSIGLLGGLLNPVTSLVGSVLNPLLGSVLNVNVSLNASSSGGSILSSLPTTFYGAVVPSSYPNQAMVSQIHAGAAAHALATGQGAVVALIDNGVDPSNPVLTPWLLITQGYNFYDNSPNWTAYADLSGGPSASSALDGQSTASVLNGQSTASVLNGQSTASVLNGGGTCALSSTPSGSGLDGQSTASVLNGQSTASVLNGQSIASVLNGASSASAANAALAEILACDPDFGHGTAVAGLIHLVAPNAMILPIKAFGPGGTADVAAIYQSITYAIDQHVNVMNLSFSAPATSPDLMGAINEAVRDGIVVVAAAGNSSTSAAVYPASLAGVVGAGAANGTVASLPLASFSNYDPGVGQFVDVDAAAPGVNLFTTFPGAGQIWATTVGTSFSTPLIAGEAALLAQVGVTGAAAHSVIDTTANPSISGDANGALGHGLINVAAAAQSATGRRR